MIDVTSPVVTELALKSALLPVAALLLTLALARRSAAERHVVWSAVVVALLAMPFAHVLLPGIEVLPRLGHGSPTPALAVPQLVESALRDPAGGERPSALRSSDAASAATAEASGLAASGLDRGEQPDDTRPDVAAPGPLGARLGLGYAAITLLLLGRLLAGLVGVRRAIGRLTPVSDPATLAILDDAAARLGLRRAVRLLESPSDTTPWAFGALSPVVVVPRGFSDWPEDARRNALVHELAHVARFDHVTAVLARACVALYWIQPLVWLAARRLAFEAERACDDHVLAAGGSRPDYAAQLLAVASAVRGSRANALPCAAMARSTAVAARISAILDPATRRTTMTRLRTTRLALAVAAVLAPIAIVKSQTPAESGDSPDAILTTLRDRGPVNSDELRAAVRAYIALGLEEQAAGLIAAYLDPEKRSRRGPGEDVAAESLFVCAYCVSQLERSLTAPPDAELEALLAALDLLEREAREESKGDILVALATTFAELDVVLRNGLSLSFLLDGIAVGNLSASYRLMAGDLLARRGWYEQAKALVEPLLDDPTSTVRKETVQMWLRYFDDGISSRDALQARLVPAAADTSEYVPLHKVAPYYPEAAAGERGWAIVQFTVTETGRTTNPEIVESSNPVFDEPALWAAKQFRYAPRILDGSPVAVEGIRNRITFVPPETH